MKVVVSGKEYCGKSNTMMAKCLAKSFAEKVNLDIGDADHVDLSKCRVIVPGLAKKKTRFPLRTYVDFFLLN